MTKFENSEFSDKLTNYYNLDMIISVGYRVKCQNGIRFRRWATQTLKDYRIIDQELNKDVVCVKFAHTTEHDTIQGKKQIHS